MRELSCHMGIENKENEGCLRINEYVTWNAATKNKMTRGVSFPVSHDTTGPCTILVKRRCNSLPASLPHLDRTTISTYEFFMRPPGQQVCLDLRERWQFNKEHVVGARNYNCSTKSMARHAVKLFEHTILSLKQSESLPETGAEAQDALIAYDASSADVSSARESVRFFINSLINLGFRVLFVQGGFAAIKELVDLTTSGQSREEWLTSTAVADTQHALFRRAYTAETPQLTLLSRASKVNEQVESCRLPAFGMKEEDTLSTDTIPLIGSNVLSAPKCHCSNEPNIDYLQTEVSRILPYLYLGNYQDAANLQLLKKLGVTHILNVTQDLPMAFEDMNSFQYLRLPALDCTEQNIYPFFEKAIDFIDGARQVGGVVLIHCLAGISRSASIVMAYMLYHTPLKVLEAYKLLQSLRPIAEPNFAFLGQLDNFRRLTSPDKRNKLVKEVLMGMWQCVSGEEQTSLPPTASTGTPIKRHLWARIHMYAPLSTASVFEHRSVP
uniref:protein-tyrosine-phosphatase n=2 Tax=Schistocephalus solidus TaxID=70667 RepID=A0A0V0J378_SCHSO